MAKATKSKTATLEMQPAQVFTRINSLLLTLRTMAQREDQLCILMHHLRTNGKLSPSLATELHEILAEIPAEEYMHDLHALREALQAAEGAPAPVRKTKSKAA